MPMAMRPELEMSFPKKGFLDFNRPKSKRAKIVGSTESQDDVENGQKRSK